MSDINLKSTELKHILKEVKCITGFDFSEYAYSFIKRRIELLMDLRLQDSWQAKPIQWR